MRTLYTTWILGLLSASVWAGEVDELKDRNAALEKRVANLEKTALTEKIEQYLERHAAADGDHSILPGGIAMRVSGEIRIRTEIKDRLYSPKDRGGDQSFDFTHMRTRLRFDVDVLENVAVIIELQDIRNFGEEGSTTGDLEGIDVKRALIHFKDLAGKPVDVEAGRYVMSYGEERLIGALEWFDQGRSYDGFRARLHPDGWWIDLFAVKVRETVTPNDDDQNFFGLYGGRKWFEGYVLYFDDNRDMAGEGGPDKTSFLTIGFRIARKTESGGWDYSTEFAFQIGDVKGDDLTAFAFAVVIGKTFQDARWTPRVGIEVAYASGNEDPDDGDTEQFQTLFPTNHRHYGYADLVGWSNILDLRARFTMKPTRTVTLSIDFHHFLRPEDQGAWINAGGAVVRPGLDGADDTLGDEVDLVITWKPNKPVTFQAGYAIFLPGGFIEDTGNDPTAHFFYFQTRVKF